MPSKTDSSMWKRTLASATEDFLTVRTLGMLAAGIVAGYSIGIIGDGSVAIPGVGSVPGTLVGVVGLALALAVYQRGSCCEDCGEKSCGCTGECGDSCSYED